MAKMLIFDGVVHCCREVCDGSCPKFSGGCEKLDSTNNRMQQIKKEFETWPVWKKDIYYSEYAIKKVEVKK